MKSSSLTNRHSLHVHRTNSFPHIQFIPTTIIEGPVNLFKVGNGGGWFFNRPQNLVCQWTVSSNTKCKAWVAEIKYNKLMSV